MLAHQLGRTGMVAIQAPPPPGPRVLVAEDEWLTARELEATLSTEGYRVVGPAPSVEAALRLIATQGPPDLALLDVNLRGRLVTPVAKELAARGVPFLLVTAYAERDLGDPILTNAPRLAKPAARAALLTWLRGAFTVGTETSPG